MTEIKNWAISVSFTKKNQIVQNNVFNIDIDRGIKKLQVLLVDDGWNYKRNLNIMQINCFISNFNKSN